MTTKTTRELAPGDVLDYGEELTDTVVSVTAVRNSVVSRIDVMRRFGVNVVKPTWFYAGNEAEHELVLVPGVDYEVAVCDVCGRDEHTPAELAACTDSALGPVEVEG